MGVHNRTRQHSRTATWKDVLFWSSLGVFLASFVSGCGDFFASKPTELESKNLLRELETVRISPGKDIPLPDVYRQPPKIVESEFGEHKDAKLFYFSRYHTVDKLQALISAQFVKQFMGAKNKTYPVVDYNVATNPATNQIIVRCPSVEDAEQVLEFLRRVDVPPIQIKIDCLISEVYADHTLDWETQVMVENLFGEEITLDGYLPGAALRDAARDGFGMDIGYEDLDEGPGHRFSALVDVLVSRGYLKILMNPQLEVVNGQTAKITASEHVRLDTITDVDPTGTKRISTRYTDVLDSLEITPRVFADGYIGIETRALIGSKATPEGVTQSPIITTREVIVRENRIRQGESLVIGGIRKTEQRSVVRGVPFLKDIPLIGILFSSKDFEERGKEVLFILTPTISTGGIPNEEMVAEIQRKHTPVRNKDNIVDSITDPLGTGVYTELVEEEATRAEVRRVKAEMQRAHAERKARSLEERLLQTQEQLEQLEGAAAESQAEADQLKAAAEAAQQKAAAAEAEKAKVIEESQKLTEAAKTAEAEAAKLKAEAEAARAAAEKARKEAEAEVAKWMLMVQQAEGEPQATPAADGNSADPQSPPNGEEGAAEQAEQDGSSDTSGSAGSAADGDKDAAAAEQKAPPAGGSD